jgi:ribosomal protein S18 acetylase RimI-like enzyme
MTELFLAARRQTMPYLPELYSDAQVHSWISGIVLRHCTVTVAECDGRVVGFSAVQGEWLEHLYVSPNHQGAGIGTELLAAAKAERPQGLRLHVFQKNLGARRFYERHGFGVVVLRDGQDNEEHEPDAEYAWPAPAAR